LNEQEQALINQDNWFGQRTQNFKDSLLKNAKLITLNAGDALFLRGDENTGLYCVINGVLRVSGVNSQGKEAVLSFVTSAMWFGEVALFDGGRRTHDVYAQTAVRLLHVPERALSQLLQEHPAYWHDFGLLLTKKVRNLFDSLEDHALLTAKQKVSKRLYMLYQSSMQNSLPLTQQQLADMTYLTRQTINQILQSLQADSIINLKYQSIEIIDIDKLQSQC
jgi:CRP-like cAMP-binding protein